MYIHISYIRCLTKITDLKLKKTVKETCFNLKLEIIEVEHVELENSAQIPTQTYRYTHLYSHIYAYKYILYSDAFS